jgi:hypothetical protein
MYRTIAIAVLALALVTVALVLTLVDIGYFGFPFSVQIGERATASFVAVAPKIGRPGAIEEKLEQFAAENGFSFQLTRIPGDAGHRINLVMANPNVGQFVVDNHLNVRRYACYFYSHGHNEAGYSHTLAIFKQVFTSSGVAIQAES